MAEGEGLGAPMHSSTLGGFRLPGLGQGRGIIQEHQTSMDGICFFLGLRSPRLDSRSELAPALENINRCKDFVKG